MSLKWVEVWWHYFCCESQRNSRTSHLKRTNEADKRVRRPVCANLVLGGLTWVSHVSMLSIYLILPGDWIQYHVPFVPFRLMWGPKETKCKTFVVVKDVFAEQGLQGAVLGVTFAMTSTCSPCAADRQAFPVSWQCACRKIFSRRVRAAPKEPLVGDEKPRSRDRA